jgi:GNAT superfamily N-acetyltransferase
MVDIEYTWRGSFTNSEVNALHADAFAHRLYGDADWDWQRLCREHSLGWVTARRGEALVGFVNVVWDGFVHAWLQDEMVVSGAQRQGIGVALIREATFRARAAGCEWLHVDFDDDLRPFYLGAAGFTETNAGLIDLTKPTD